MGGRTAGRPRQEGDGHLAADAITAGGVRGVGERWDGRRVAAVDFCLLLPLLVWLLVLNKTSVCVKNLN